MVNTYAQQAQKFYNDCVAGMDACSRELLLRIKPGATAVYTWDPDTQSAHKASLAEVPWYIQYSLSFSQKHVFSSSRRSSITSTSQRIDDWQSKIRWRTLLKDHTSETDWWKVCRSKGIRVKEAPGTDLVVLERMLSRSAFALKNAFYRKFVFQASKQTSSCLFWFEMFGKV